ncbi:serine/threonine-protein phosphatase 2A activator-like [Dysidea avara]|uniref:serine/threonine-protein phosphatase 2A activator-like n=1 Tax=Dysidea avara TaxID=196820 RepID=UPI003319AE99
MASEFEAPKKLINKLPDLQKWQKSEAYSDYVNFVMILNSAVKGKKISDPYPASKTVEAFIKILDTLESWVEEIPPIDQPQRFGNKAFRQWHDKLKENSELLLASLLTDQQKPATIELAAYFNGGFGDYTRLDYGTGHEASFVGLLCCLMKMRVFQEEDATALALKVFNRYIEVCRKIQTTYRLEPAGSHGVWGLDDYQFIPFVWGSSQLIGHPDLMPDSFVKQEVVEAWKHDYMFMAAVAFINTVKTGPFAEHSNSLYGISGVAEWTKVNSGLIKMYKAEVLGKFPVIQHFLFGKILSL